MTRRALLAWLVFHARIIVLLVCGQVFGLLLCNGVARAGETRDTRPDDGGTHVVPSVGVSGGRGGGGGGAGAGVGGGAPSDPHASWSVVFYNSCKACPPPEKLIARLQSAVADGNKAWLTKHMAAAKVRHRRVPLRRLQRRCARHVWSRGADVDAADGLRKIWRCGGGAMDN